jgi:hypothetical protein
VQTSKLDAIGRVHAGHSLVSPQPPPTRAGSGGFCATAACVQPYEPHPPISVQQVE